MIKLPPNQYVLIKILIWPIMAFTLNFYHAIVGTSMEKCQVLPAYATKAIWIVWISAADV